MIKKVTKSREDAARRKKMKTLFSGSNKMFTDNLSEPLNDTTTAKIEIDSAAGNLIIDGFTGGEQVLASGALEYFEKQGPPTRTVDSNNGQSTLTLRGGGSGKPWFHFPWAACNGAHEWQIHLNPAVSFDITARSGGGNVRLDLAGMTVTRLSADTGGGNMEVILPDDAADLSVSARSGAGNVVVHVPSGIAARIHASSGLGKVIVDSCFTKIDGNTYESLDYGGSADKVEITASTGAGNVSVSAS